jgi:hypothetical protein
VIANTLSRFFQDVVFRFERSTNVAERLQIMKLLAAEEAKLKLEPSRKVDSPGETPVSTG